MRSSTESLWQTRTCAELPRQSQWYCYRFLWPFDAFKIPKNIIYCTKLHETMGDFLCFFIKLSGIVVRCLLWAAKKTDGKKRACLFLHWAFCTEKTNSQDLCQPNQVWANCWFTPHTITSRNCLGEFESFHRNFVLVFGKIHATMYYRTFEIFTKFVWNIHQICTGKILRPFFNHFWVALW